jgi:hypothetical protein
MRGLLTKVGTDSLEHCDCSGGWTSINYHFTFRALRVIWEKLVGDLTEAKLGGLYLQDRSGMPT